MSATPRTPVPQDLQGPVPMTLPRLAEKKRLGEKIVMMTAYDYPSAQVAQEAGVDVVLRSEEHTSELQSQSNLVCRLLLEKKKKNKQQNYIKQNKIKKI